RSGHGTRSAPERADRGAGARRAATWPDARSATARPRPPPPPSRSRRTRRPTTDAASHVERTPRSRLRAMTAFDELARLGVATAHERMGQRGLIDLPLAQVLPASAASWSGRG